MRAYFAGDGSHDGLPSRSASAVAVFAHQAGAEDVLNVNDPPSPLSEVRSPRSPRNPRIRLPVTCRGPSSPWSTGADQRGLFLSRTPPSHHGAGDPEAAGR